MLTCDSDTYEVVVYGMRSVGGTRLVNEAGRDDGEDIPCELQACLPVR